MSSVSNILRTSSAPKASAAPTVRNSASSNDSTDFANLLSPKVEKNEKQNTLLGNDKPRAQSVKAGPEKDSSPGRGIGKISDSIEPKAPIKMNSTEPTVQKKFNSEISNPIENSEPDESVDNLGHRQALQRFLQKMKDQFGLDAEQIVGAFAQLTPQELEQPPELSLNKLLEILPLAPEQKEQARGIFEDMLKQTAASGMADYLSASHRQLSLEVLSQAEAQKRAMDQSVEDMQSQFFAAQPKKVSTAQALEKYQIKKDEDKSDSSTLLSASALGQGAIQNPIANAPAKTVGTIASQSAKSAEAPSEKGNRPQAQAESPVETKGSPSTTDNLGIDWKSLGMTAATDEESSLQASNQPIEPKIEDSKLIGNNSSQVKEAVLELPDFSVNSALQEKAFKGQKHYEAQNASLLGKANLEQAQPTRTSPSFSAPTAAQTSNVIPGFSAAAPMTSEESTGQEEESSNGQSQDFSQVRGAQVNKNNSISSNAQDAFIINAKPNSTQDAANIKEVINQAQFLAKKGGGEMKVKLNPEGLGEVTMKVAVKSGQVSIEMTTQSNEAKKILEKGLGDLKANLMSHDLRVDQIKVDMPSDVSRQLTRNHDEAQRQFAQQFMEQFRQDNNEWRRGFTDIPGARAYRSQREDARTGATERSGDDKSRRASSRRLDLVA